jgi:hypothetical protein
MPCGHPPAAPILIHYLVVQRIVYAFTRYHTGNMAPTQNAMVVCHHLDTGERHLDLLKLRATTPPLCCDRLLTMC